MYIQCADSGLPHNEYHEEVPTSIYEIKSLLTLTIHAHRQNTTASLPPEDRKQLEEAQRKASTQAANAASGVAGTLGGAVKGVLDTAGNTVTIHPPPFFVFFLVAGKSCDMQRPICEPGIRS